MRTMRLKLSSHLPSALTGRFGRTFMGSTDSQGSSRRERKAHAEALDGRFQIQLNQSWADVDEGENMRLLEALATGKDVIRVECRAHACEYSNLQSMQDMQQTNLVTGRQRPVRFQAWVSRMPLDRDVESWSTASSRECTPRTPGCLEATDATEEKVGMSPWLHVDIPNGPVEVSGCYRLQDDQVFNGFPVWRKVDTSADEQIWISSTLDHYWAIVSQDELWAFCPVAHEGKCPSKMPPAWHHNEPAWSMDPTIKIETIDECDLSTIIASDCHSESLESPGSSLQLAY